MLVNTDKIPPLVAKIVWDDQGWLNVTKTWAQQFERTWKLNCYLPYTSTSHACRAIVLVMGKLTDTYLLCRPVVQKYRQFLHHQVLSADSGKDQRLLSKMFLDLMNWSCCQLWCRNLPTNNLKQSEIWKDSNSLHWSGQILPQNDIVLDIHSILWEQHFVAKQEGMFHTTIVCPVCDLYFVDGVFLLQIHQPPVPRLTIAVHAGCTTPVWVVISIWMWMHQVNPCVIIKHKGIEAGHQKSEILFAAWSQIHQDMNGLSIEYFVGWCVYVCGTHQQQVLGDHRLSIVSWDKLVGSEQGWCHLHWPGLQQQMFTWKRKVAQKYGTVKGSTGSFREGHVL